MRFHNLFTSFASRNPYTMHIFRPVGQKPPIQMIPNQFSSASSLCFKQCHRFSYLYIATVRTNVPFIYRRNYQHTASGSHEQCAYIFSFAFQLIQFVIHLCLRYPIFYSSNIFRWSLDGFCFVSSVVQRQNEKKKLRKWLIIISVQRVKVYVQHMPKGNRIENVNFECRLKFIIIQPNTKSNNHVVGKKAIKQSCALYTKIATQKRYIVKNKRKTLSAFKLLSVSTLSLYRLAIFFQIIFNPSGRIISQSPIRCDTYIFIWLKVNMKGL